MRAAARSVRAATVRTSPCRGVRRAVPDDHRGQGRPQGVPSAPVAARHRRQAVPGSRSAATSGARVDRTRERQDIPRRGSRVVRTVRRPRRGSRGRRVASDQRQASIILRKATRMIQLSPLRDSWSLGRWFDPSRSHRGWPDHFPRFCVKKRAKCGAASSRERSSGTRVSPVGSLGSGSQPGGLPPDPRADCEPNT